MDHLKKLAMCCAILVTTACSGEVQYNPANNQDPIANELARKALAYHGILTCEWNGKEYGFWRKGKWCSLYRSLPEDIFDEPKR